MSTVVLVALLAAVIITTAQAWLTWRFTAVQDAPRPPGGSPGPLPFVSILKPVCGLDDELEENLISFVRLEGIRYEVIVSAEEWGDPALDVVRRVLRAHPGAPFRIVVDGGSRSGVVNRKVERLIAAARAAAGDIFFISDSNVRVAPDDVAKTVAYFGDPRVGCVSSLFTGSGATTIGATLESLHLLGFVVPGAVLAATAGVPCVVGKSMAISRRVHDTIGGFARFVRVLAEDQAVGLAVRQAGFEVVLASVVVRNVVVNRTLRRAVDRQVRWNKIRYSFSHPLYWCELLTNPVPIAIAATLFAPALLVLPVLAARYLQMALLNHATQAGMTWRQLALTPLLDLMMLYAWFVPFVSNEITWRGYRARIGRNTEMVQIAA